MKRSAEVKASQLFGGVPVRLHFRNDIHLVRKLWHMVMGLFIVYCYLSGTTRPTAIALLLGFLALDLVIESLRLRNSEFNSRLMKFWGPFMRAHEARQMSTIPHYLSAVTIAIAVFPFPVAVLSILYLACGDPMASLFGILYGQNGIKIKKDRSLIGTMAGIITCTAVGFVYLKTLNLPGFAFWTLTLLGGIVGGTVELLPFKIDDNFSIPIVSGFVMWLAFICLGI